MIKRNWVRAVQANCCEALNKEFFNRKEVLEAIMINNLKTLKEEYNTEKLKHLKNTNIQYMQIYMTQTSLENARLEFKYRTRMM